MVADVRDSVPSFTNTTGITPTMPTHVTGDRLVFFVAGYDSVTLPGGYSSHLSYTYPAAFGATGCIRVCSKIAASGAESAPTFTHGVADEVIAIAASLSGVDATTPVDGTPGSNNWVGAQAKASPSITDLAGADSLLLCYNILTRSSDNTAPLWTPPGGMTELEDYAEFNAVTLAKEQLVSSAATGIKTFTAAFADGDGTGLSIAFESAPPAGPEGSWAWSFGVSMPGA